MDKAKVEESEKRAAEFSRKVSPAHGALEDVEQNPDSTACLQLKLGNSASHREDVLSCVSSVLLCVGKAQVQLSSINCASLQLCSSAVDN